MKIVNYLHFFRRKHFQSSKWENKVESISKCRHLKFKFFNSKLVEVSKQRSGIDNFSTFGTENGTSLPP